MRQAVWSDSQEPCPFAVTCTVTAVTHCNNSCWVADPTGCAYLRSTNSLELLAGDRIAASGHVGIDKFGWKRAFVETAHILERGAALPPPIEVAAAQLADESLDGKTVVMKGIVEDVVRDEIDPAWRFLIMRSESGPFFAAMPVADDEALAALIGATVSARGVANVLPDGGKRKFQTPQLTIPSMDGVSVEVPAPKDPSCVQRIPPFPQRSLENLRYKSVDALSRMGLRSVEGVVIAAYAEGTRLLMKTDDGQIVGAVLRQGPPPAYGERIVAAGLPTTDLFIITLTSAWFKSVGSGAAPAAPAIPLKEGFSMETVLRDVCARGQAVRVRGRVTSRETDDGESAHGVFQVRHGRRLVKVDAGAVASKVGAIAVGSLVEVSGTCVRNTSQAIGIAAFPRTEGFTIVPRSADDIAVLAPPPWWTASRLVAVILALVAILVSVAVWNRTLRRLAERRGRQLYRREIEKAEAELRVDERTRLAVELHDSIAQILAGVSFQIDAAEATLRTDTDCAARLLAAVRLTLLSCREELRRCLWDLRNETLSEPDFQSAIEKTVHPNVGDAHVAVRFHAHRSRIPDTTAHNVLRIIRELCVNAVRHGGAKNVHVVGETKDGMLRFAVRDDGCGFDTANRPGPAEGHFGLQGIKERVSRMHGKFGIESSPGKGAKAILEIKL